MSDRAKIRRGTKPRQTVQTKRKAQAKRPSMLSRTAAMVPIAPETVQRATTWGIVGVVAIALIGLAQVMGLPAMAATALGEATGRAGFAVKRVEVKGIDRMERLTVYAIALDQQSQAMPLVDLERIRAQLKTYGWVSDARVSRRLPDTLVIDIVERSPAAIWQNRGRLALIDRSGVVLEDVALDAMPDLPLVIGPAANGQIGNLDGLMRAAPQLQSVLAGASWIGGRRWDLRFHSGETLALPEGDGAARKALLRFAQMDAADRLLGRGFLRFDMRDPTKFVVRVDRNRKAIDDAVDGGASETIEQAGPQGAAGQLVRVSKTI